jgi:hypothetical protein
MAARLDILVENLGGGCSVARGSSIRDMVSGSPAVRWVNRGLAISFLSRRGDFGERIDCAQARTPGLSETANGGSAAPDADFRTRRSALPVPSALLVRADEVIG